MKGKTVITLHLVIAFWLSFFRFLIFHSLSFYTSVLLHTLLTVNLLYLFNSFLYQNFEFSRGWGGEGSLLCFLSKKDFITNKEFWCCDISTSSQVSNCDGVLLENYLNHNFQWPQDGLNCESLPFGYSESA